MEMVGSSMEDSVSFVDWFLMSCLVDWFFMSCFLVDWFFMSNFLMSFLVDWFFMSFLVSWFFMSFLVSWFFMGFLVNWFFMSFVDSQFLEDLSVGSTTLFSSEFGYINQQVMITTEVSVFGVSNSCFLSFGHLVDSGPDFLWNWFTLGS